MSFSNKKWEVFSFIIFATVVSYAFINGFRMPNLWSINYYLPGFFDGFFRRSLPGTFLIFLGDLRFNYYIIAFIQFLVLISLLIWIYYFFKKNIFTLLIISLYFLSPAGGYLFHEVGYADQLLYLILFISIYIFPKHEIFSALLFASSMFVHELALFVTLPIFFTYIYMTTGNLKKSIIYILPSIIAFILIYFFFQTVPIDTINMFKEKIIEFSNYEPRKGYYGIFKNTFIKKTGIRYDNNIQTIKNIIMLFILSYLTSFITYKISRKIILSISVFFIGILPLALGFFGWDIYRWFFLAISSLTIIFILVILHYQVKVKINFRIVSLYLIVALLVFNINLIYFDKYKPRSISFHSLQEIKKEFLKIPKR